MDAKLLESLLHQKESEALDFKVDQYPFDHATDEEKSEILKDILAFANAWRQTDAYILIGVEEVRAGRSIVRGIKQPFWNRNLQQFVNSKTNRPVDFSYSTFTSEGSEIDVLTIPLQERPVFLLKTYGKVAANVVYIRRGDTTDIAAPDEIARMGSAAVLAQAQPVLTMEFTDPKNRKKLGTSLSLEVMAFEMPNPQDIPSYGKPPRQFLGTTLDIDDAMTNRNYYRDLAAYLQTHALHSEIGIAITNSSSAPAQGVLVTLEFDGREGVSILDDDEFPQFPSTSRTFPMTPRRPSSNKLIEVARHGDLIEIRAEFDAIQPGVTAWSDNVVRLGAPRSRSVIGNGSISAHNLQTPKLFTVEIAVTTSSRRLEVADIMDTVKKAAHDE